MLKNPNLWVLEDDRELREVIMGVGARCGYAVTVFRDLHEAWMGLARASTSGLELAPLCVIGDFKLGDGLSEEWLLRVRTSFPSAKVVCVSGVIRPDSIARLKRSSIDAIEKPITLFDLFEILKKPEAADEKTG